MSRRRFLAGSSVAAAGTAGLLAGCGGETPAPSPLATEPPTVTPTPPAVATETPATAPASTPATTPVPRPEGPRRGGTLKLWKTEEDAGLDPGVFHLNNTEVIYSTMTQPYTYQPTKNLIAMDGMAGFEQVDPTTFVWSIRPGMRFHDMAPVDSAAVAFSFDRLEKLHQALKGTHTTRTGYAFVDSFEPTDELTLTEHWALPNADAPVYRARSYYSFVNPRILEEHGKLEGSYEHPDGTPEDVFSVQSLPHGSGSGPYTLTKRDSTGTRVERWPHYHKHTPAEDGFVEDGPYIDAWETRILPDREVAKWGFIAGELDVFDSIAAEELAEFEGLDHVSVAEIPNGSIAMMGMDGDRFHDRRARQAIRRALDYEAFIAAFRPLGGRYAAPISDLLPHFQRLTQQELKQWYRYDPKQARALWESAHFEVPVEPLHVLWHYSGDPNAEPNATRGNIAEFIAQSLRETLGVDASAVARSWNWYSNVDGPEHMGIVSYGSGNVGGTTGLPFDTHLVHYDPRAYGMSAFNHYADSPRPEIAADSLELTAMLEVQEQETAFDARVELLTEIQRWILDRAWCALALPRGSVSHYGFSSRLRDHAPEDWPNLYGLRRESMWLAD